MNWFLSKLESVSKLKIQLSDFLTRCPDNISRHLGKGTNSMRTHDGEETKDLYSLVHLDSIHLYSLDTLSENKEKNKPCTLLWSKRLNNASVLCLPQQQHLWLLDTFKPYSEDGLAQWSLSLQTATTGKRVRLFFHYPASLLPFTEGQIVWSCPWNIKSNIYVLLTLIDDLISASIAWFECILTEFYTPWTVWGNLLPLGWQKWYWVSGGGRVQSGDGPDWEEMLSNLV